MRPNRTIRRILVAIGDTRSRSRASLVKAAQIARACHAELELFHDISKPVFVEVIDQPAMLKRVTRDGRRAVLADLERLAAPLRASGLTVHTATEWDYPAHEAIIRHALRVGSDLIVTQSRARHRLPALLGYTDWSLLRDSPVPVLLVKSNRRYRRPKILAAIDPLHPYAKPSGLDQNILREAQTLATALGSAFHVIYAYRPLLLAPTGTAVSISRAASTIEARARSAARAALDHALRHSAVSAARRHLVEAHPVDAITAAARRLSAAIVVMGAISRRGLKRLFIGNYAEQLLDELRCDLLVVKPARFATDVPRSRRGVYLMSTIAT
ncbi:MAG TPA: universal stress protein [Steroidobacteraceae bacterium]|jgi:universal stress protein E|nr:universal stress protein [Steroidobacteraceae bacterium]